MTPSAAILCAGPVPIEIAALFRCSSIGLIPLNGRPLIAWQLDYLSKIGIETVRIGIRKSDRRLADYLETYRRLFQASIEIIQIEDDRGPGGTLLQTVSAEDAAGGTLVLLGDTLLEPETILELSEGSRIFTSEVDDVQRWCMVDSDPETGEVLSLTDKPKSSPSENARAAIGCYWLQGVEEQTWQKLQDIKEKKIELSTILRSIGEAHGLREEALENWLDCGNADLLVTTRRRMIAARAFNSLAIDDLRGTVKKRSQHSEKFRHEINYYRLLPPDLAIYFPRLVSYETAEPEAFVELEYYAYPTMSEIYIYEEYSDSFWTGVFAKLSKIMGEFRSRTVALNPQTCSGFYSGKLDQRLETARNSGGEIASLLASENVKVNGKSLRGISNLLPDLHSELEKISQTVKASVIHGDLCFANILLEPLNKMIRLIDPRGSFAEVGVFGDPRYDAAKLWHSVDGHYDAIINDLFSISGSGNELEFESFQPRCRDQVMELLTTIIPEEDDVRTIRLIEGSLFLSMIPLHSDRPLRQKAMLASGLKILNEEL
ncbi:MAG: NTP transferase domain-containing protein [Akkermansiaceae bacterium]